MCWCCYLYIVHHYCFLQESGLFVCVDAVTYILPTITVFSRRVVWLYVLMLLLIYCPPLLFSPEEWFDCMCWCCYLYIAHHYCFLQKSGLFVCVDAVTYILSTITVLSTGFKLKGFILLLFLNYIFVISIRGLLFVKGNTIFSHRENQCG
jgi:hypothetical protein